LRTLLTTITTQPARLLRLPEYGLTPGSRADLVVWDCVRAEEAVTALPPRILVVKRGRVTVEARHEVIDRWRSP
jgi:cytosine deaminase